MNARSHNSRLARCLIASVLCLGLAACKEEPVPVSQPKPPVPNYPFEQIVRSHDGREIVATIEGRQGDNIIFTREDDEEPTRHEYAIGLIDEDQQEFFRRLRQKQWYPPSPYEQSMRREIERLERNIRDAANERSSPKLTGHQRRALSDKLRELEGELRLTKTTLQQRLKKEREERDAP